MVAAAKPCVFLYRAGVIVVPQFRQGRSYAPTTLKDFRYFSVVQEALLRLNAAGYLLIVITNQPDVGNGLVPLELVETMHDKMYEELPIDHIEVCYHTASDNCACRKPKPGMLLNAINKFNINLEKSFMIGDRFSDVEAGKQLNLITFFINHHYQELLITKPDYICKDLLACVEIILSKKCKNLRQKDD